MTVTYGFFDSLDGDRTYNAGQMSRLFEGVITDGVFATVGEALVVSAESPASMNVSVAPGRAWFNHYWILNDNDLILSVDPSDAVLNRIDVVVVEINSDISVRQNTIKIVKGASASSPVAPAMIHTSTVNQYPLAHIYVGASVSTISGANITNKVGTAETPFITAPLETIDATSFFAQLEADFNVWFAEMQGQLSTDAAGNLQLQIDAEELARANADTDLQDQIDALASGPTSSGDWEPVEDTWTYSTPLIATVPSDATLKYSVGNRIKLTQSGNVKYFYVIAVAATSLTLFGGSSYSLANSAITNISLSRAASPSGFPSSFPYTPTLWNVTVGNGISSGNVHMIGNKVSVDVKFAFPAASPTCSINGQIGVYLPISISPATQYYTVLGSGALVDYATALYMGACVYNAGVIELRVINTASTYAVWAAPSATIPFTWNVNDFFTLRFEYFT